MGVKEQQGAARQGAGLSREQIAPAGEDAFEAFPSEVPDLEPSGGDAFDEFATETTVPTHGVPRHVPEGARRSRFRDAVLPVALIALFVGGAALGAFLMYRSESSEAPAPAASQPVSTSDARQADKTPGVGTTGPAAPDNSAHRDSAVTGPTGPATPAPAPRATAAAPAPVEISAAARRPESRVENDPSPLPASDLSGEWTLNTEVESSRLSRYEGLRLSYRLQLEQHGNAVRGNGRKVLENGKPIGGGGQTPITVEGTADGDQLHLTFTERGARRPSSGTFVMNRDGNDRLRGRFASDAARSAGRVEARRAPVTQLR
jgi:hypothetical protein